MKRVSRERADSALEKDEQEEEDGVLLEGRPVERVARIIGRLGDEDSPAIGGGLEQARIIEQLDL